MTLIEIKRLIALCRKNGIVSIKCDGVDIIFGDSPVKVTRTSKKAAAKAEVVSDNTKFETDSLSAEALLFWSSGDPLQQKLDEASSES